LPNAKHDKARLLLLMLMLMLLMLLHVHEAVHYRPEPFKTFAAMSASLPPSRQLPRPPA
jgi:hypothetical protein